VKVKCKIENNTYFLSQVHFSANIL
jgi:hypothetical protein